MNISVELSQNELRVAMRALNRFAGLEKSEAEALAADELFTKLDQHRDALIMHTDEAQAAAREEREAVHGADREPRKDREEKPGKKPDKPGKKNK
jgi:hypothetical protein